MSELFRTLTGASQNSATFWNGAFLCISGIKTPAGFWGVWLHLEVPKSKKPTCSTRSSGSNEALQAHDNHRPQLVIIESWGEDVQDFSSIAQCSFAIRKKMVKKKKVAWNMLPSNSWVKIIFTACFPQLVKTRICLRFTLQDTTKECQCRTRRCQVQQQTPAE